MIPSMDKVRPAYGIKEFTFARLICDILCLGDSHPDSKKLMHYKSPRYSKHGRNDFAEVAYEILKNRTPSKGAMTIEVIIDK